ncbi:MAG TPA: tRNA preQ1(34) S-adenosylmethionine ribosyltransferase-isomerase QueA [Candidatus Acidoferrales bacterium]
MNLDELNFDLPPERIAQHPLAARDASRMLLLDKTTGEWEDRQFREFPDLLRGDELIVLNNARVLPARLFGRRVGIHAEPPGIHNPARHEHLKAQIEVLLVRQLSPDTWETLVRPGRKISVGEKIIFGETGRDGEGELEAVAESRGEYGLRVLRFTSNAGFQEALNRLGHIPLPPYIKRADEPADRERYQTIYARQGSAVAAPTAGLHFTPEILQRIRTRGIEIAEITLDVGLGTFEPVRTERLEDHKIHVEAYEIPEATTQAIIEAQNEARPVLAVGTTVVRALEDAAEKAASRGGSTPSPGKSEAAIFLYPGKPLRVVNQLLTNFHLPRSSLLALVATLAGQENILRAYRHAVAVEYRFYSYGDCMLIR